MSSEKKHKLKQTDIGLIPEEWQVKRVKEFCLRITSGGTPSRTRPEYWDNGTIPWLKTQELTDNNIYETEETITRIGLENSSAKLFSKNTVLMAMYGATVGKLGILKIEATTNQAVCAMIVDERIADYRYLFYSLLNGREKLINLACGAAQQNLNQDIIKGFLLSFPHLQEQQSIAKILSDIDSKIELNQHMNKTLEAIGQAIFKRWFIDFEFPNEEGKPYKSNDGKMIDSELGEIPESWTVGCLGDIANNVRNPVKPEDVEPETPYIGLEHMPRRSIALADWGHAEDVSSNKSSFHRKDVLFGKLRPYFHKVGVAPIDGFCSTDILVITAKQPESFGVVLFHFASDELVKYADMASSGTKMPRTSWSDLAQHKISIPSKEIMRDFTDIISPMVDKIIGNVLQSRTLVSIRDLLLPKLMSGKIRVPVTNENVEVR